MKKICQTYLGGLPEIGAETFRDHYVDADILMEFRNNQSIQRRRNALPRCFAALRDLKEGFTGSAFVDDGPLDDLFDHISINKETAGLILDFVREHIPKR